MIVAAFDEFNVELFGSVEEFRDIRDSILDGFDSSIIIKCKMNQSEFEYSEYLDKIEIIKLEGSKIKVSKEKKSLVIRGSNESLDILSSYFDFEDNEESGFHNHLEYFEGDVYIDSDSLSLIVTIN